MRAVRAFVLRPCSHRFHTWCGCRCSVRMLSHLASLQVVAASCAHSSTLRCFGPGVGAKGRNRGTKELNYVPISYTRSLGTVLRRDSRRLLRRWPLLREVCEEAGCTSRHNQQHRVLLLTPPPSSAVPAPARAAREVQAEVQPVLLPAGSNNGGARPPRPPPPACWCPLPAPARRRAWGIPTPRCVATRAGSCGRWMQVRKCNCADGLHNAGSLVGG